MRNVLGNLVVAGYSILSLLGQWPYSQINVHTLSLLDAAKIEKHLGIFRRRRKVKTSFRRG